VRHTHSGGTVYDVLYTDRTTGKIVLKYDGADPANTNPDYGAESDSDVLARKGLDIDARIEESLCMFPVPQNTVNAYAEAEFGCEEADYDDDWG